MITPVHEGNGTPKLTIGQRVRLQRGRFRRLFLHLFRPSYIKKSHARRKGGCKRCGACCQLGNKCPGLRFDNGLSSCIYYSKYRLPNCHNFPIDERDLADRDIINPFIPCGYSFIPPVETGKVIASRMKPGSRIFDRKNTPVS